VEIMDTVDKICIVFSTVWTQWTLWTPLHADFESGAQTNLESPFLVQFGAVLMKHCGQVKQLTLNQ